MTRCIGRVAVTAWLCAVSIGFAETTDPTSPPTPQDTTQFHLFLLVGQSNMAGRGRVTDIDRKIHERVLAFNKQRKWEPAIDPLHFDKPRIVGVGLGKTFGIEIAQDNPDVTVGLIPCAVGGSPISSWQAGQFYNATKSHPWDDAIARAKAAQKYGTLKGILWHQGESDSKEGLAEVYEEKPARPNSPPPNRIELPGCPVSRRTDGAVFRAPLE